MSHWRRTAMLLLVVAIGTVSYGVPAKAAPYVNPLWVSNCTGCKAIVPRDGTPIRVAFGIYNGGIVLGAQVVLDTSGLDGAKVTVVGVDGPCAAAAPVFTCDFGTIGSGTHWAWVTLKAIGGLASGGAAGSVTVSTGTTPHDGSSTTIMTGEAYLSSTYTATDAAISTSTETARIGEVTMVTYTIRNNGPSVEPYVEIELRSQPGTSYVDGEGCRVLPEGPRCRADNIPVGGVAWFKPRFRVDSCPPEFGGFGGAAVLWQGIEDTDHHNDLTNFEIEIAGCPKYNGGGSSGGGAKPLATLSASPSASPTPSPEPSATPSPAPSLSESGAPVAVVRDAPNWLYGSAAAGFALFAVGALFLRWRRVRGY